LNSNGEFKPRLLVIIVVRVVENEIHVPLDGHVQFGTVGRIAGVAGAEWLMIDNLGAECQVNEDVPEDAFLWQPVLFAFLVDSPADLGRLVVWQPLVVKSQGILPSRTKINLNGARRNDTKKMAVRKAEVCVESGSESEVSVGQSKNAAPSGTGSLPPPADDFRYNAHKDIKRDDPRVALSSPPAPAIAASEHTGTRHSRRC
jgi:hypothetical protein